MAENNETADARKALFIELVIMLGSSAMQQLGKIINPATGKTEVHLQGAQATIDMLDMIRAKTAGNLDKDEARLLNDTLSTLQLNYVETAQAQPSPAAPPQPAASEPAPSPVSAPAGEKQATPTDPSTQPKFHKTYG